MAEGNEMVERVAWAILDKVPFGYGMTQEEAAVYARAAIEAMREPTDAMLGASNREWDGRMSHRSSGAWTAMIDAALLSDKGRNDG